MPAADRYTPDRSKLLGSHGQRPWFKQPNSQDAVLLDEFLAPRQARVDQPRKRFLRQAVRGILFFRNARRDGTVSLNQGQLLGSLLSRHASGKPSDLYRRAVPPACPRGADQKWKEAKRVTFYDLSGRHRYTAATTGNHRILGRLMRRHARQLGLDKAERKYSVSDGADWIGHQYQQQLPMLDARVLDHFHLRAPPKRSASA